MRMRWLALVAVVAACGGSAAPQAQSASSVAAVPPSPTWSLGLGPTAISTVDFSCRLPISAGGGPGPQGAFIDFPSGTVTPDPAAPPVNSLVRPGRDLYGYYPTFYYDRAYSRWLPVSRMAVSPDGAHYAFTDRPLINPPGPSTRATLHVVAVKSGADSAFDGGDWTARYVVLDYAAEGIYLITDYGAYVGLWLMDPTTGAVSRVANLLNVQGSAGGNVFWVGTHNPSDRHPVTGNAPNQLERLSLTDGSRATWFYRPGSSVHFVSQDASGNPIIIVSGVNWAELRLVLGPGIDRPIWTDGDRVPVISDPISDSHGTWFGSQDGIFLYSDANGVRKVSNQPGYPANGCL
jgi:hypothetical protein